MYKRQYRRTASIGLGKGSLFGQMRTPSGIAFDAAGRLYVMERALHADFAFVKAWRGDSHGNLVFRRTARNFNPIMATGARVTIAEVEELVEPGVLDPDDVHTPGVFVARIFQGEGYEKRIEKRTTRDA